MPLLVTDRVRPGMEKNLIFWNVFKVLVFYAPQVYRQVLLRRVLAMGILSACLSRPGGIPSPGEIETPGLHHMVAWSI